MKKNNSVATEEHPRFEHYAKLHSDISRDVREAEYKSRYFAFTTTGLEMALAHKANEAARLVGSFGNIGCGDSGSLYIALDEETQVKCLIDDDGNLTLPDGAPELAETEMNEEERAEYADILLDPQWNGHNHVNPALKGQSVHTHPLTLGISRKIENGVVSFQAANDYKLLLEYTLEAENDTFFDAPDGFHWSEDKQIDIERAQNLLRVANIESDAESCRLYDEHGSQWFVTLILVVLEADYERAAKILLDAQVDEDDS